jgi:hypothetical protein
MANSKRTIAPLLTVPSGMLAAMTITLSGFATPPAPHQHAVADEPSLPRYTRRLNREQPIVAVLGYNASTEVTDFVVPYGIYLP